VHEGHKQVGVRYTPFSPLGALSGWQSDAFSLKLALSCVCGSERGGRGAKVGVEGREVGTVRERVVRGEGVRDACALVRSVVSMV
jgi:hypothetical protein